MCLNYKVLNVLKVCLVLFNFAVCAERERNTTITEIEEVFNTIDQNHDRLRKLFESVLIEPVTEGRNNKDEKGGCVCVPYYLCYDGAISRDGRYLLESRYQGTICPNQIDVCCQEPIFRTPPHSSCGHRGNITKLDTIGEEDVSDFGEHPWTVIILKDNVSYKCVGSLIHPQVVLTAAHCVNTSDNYSIRAGEWDIRNEKEPLPYQTKTVQRVIKHSEFNIDNSFYDAALLVLDEPFRLAENVKVVCLTESAPYPLETNYDKCVATGWGLDKATGRYKRIMKKIEFSLILREQCERSLRATRLGRWFKLHSTFVCALGQNGRDLCMGDGGGPLVCSIQGEPQRYQQIGVTSWGIGCGEKIPSVFTRIAQIRNWIDAQFDMLKFTKDYSHDPQVLLY